MKNMKMTALMMLAALLALVGQVFADTTVGFDAVNLRPANDGSGYAFLQESAGEAGIEAQTDAAGQKIFYGTEYFNGWKLDQIDNITFTFKDGLKPTNPYMNLVITNGLGAYGIISSQGGYNRGETVYDSDGDLKNDTTVRTVQYYFAGNNGNETYGFNFYEPNAAPWTHGQHLTWNDIKDWSLLGIGDTRPYTDNAGNPEKQFGNDQARGPLSHGVAIMWGDSQNNYLGYRQIYDIVVTDNSGQKYTPGVVPAPGAIVLGMMGVGLVGWIKRRFA